MGVVLAVPERPCPCGWQPPVNARVSILHGGKEDPEKNVRIVTPFLEHIDYNCPMCGTCHRHMLVPEVDGKVR